MEQGLRVAIVGATGAVGGTLLDLMTERKFPFSALSMVASSRSAGKKISYRHHDYIVHDLEHFDFSHTDIAFFSAGTSTSKRYVERAVRAGTLVIDNTNAFRMTDNVPLVVPQVNGELLKTRPDSLIVANPNCSTIPIVRVIKPIHSRYQVKKWVASTYQAASGAGNAGMKELQADSHAYLKGEKGIQERFPVPLGFNVVPFIDVYLDNGFTLEEQKMLQESRKILAMPLLHVSATTVRVPVLNCHSASVYFECETEIDVESIYSLLKNESEMSVYEGKNYPTPRFISEANHVHVGRVRRDPLHPCCGWFWVVSDNLRIGAALNAIQIAESLSTYGVFAS